MNILVEKLFLYSSNTLNKSFKKVKILFDFIKKIQKAMEKPDTIPAQCVEGYNNSLKKVDIRYLFENFVLFLSMSTMRMSHSEVFSMLRKKNIVFDEEVFIFFENSENFLGGTLFDYSYKHHETF